MVTIVTMVTIITMVTIVTLVTMVMCMVTFGTIFNLCNHCYLRFNSLNFSNLLFLFEVIVFVCSPGRLNVDVTLYSRDPTTSEILFENFTNFAIYIEN